MACEWRAPCGCIIEFENQTVDTGEPVKHYKKQCERHAVIEDHHKRATTALDEIKHINCTHAELEVEGISGAHVGYEGPHLVIKGLPPTHAHKHDAIVARAKARRKTLRG